jgi:hypothetical protein
LSRGSSVLLVVVIRVLELRIAPGRFDLRVRERSARVARVVSCRVEVRQWLLAEAVGLALVGRCFGRCTLVGSWGISRIGLVGCGSFGRGRSVFEIGLDLRIELFVAGRLRGHVSIVAFGMLAPAGEVGVEVIRPDEVLDVQERRALLPDVDERRLKARKDPCHSSEDDVPYATGVLVAGALDMKLGDDSVFDEGDARLFDVDANDE